MTSFNNVMETLEGDDIEAVMELMKAPRNMQDPVWTRWMTTVKAAILVVDRWTIIYFTMVACKSSKKASSSLAKTATDALSLMRTKASNECSTPSFKAELLFLKAFAESYFTNKYDMAMRADPEFGRESFGYTSRLCVEGCYTGRK